MLKEIHFENWKSFGEATLYIDPLTVLIGSNASGKSNALDALLLLNRLASGVNVTTALAGDSHIKSLRGGLEWACLHPYKRFALSVVAENKELGPSTEFLYRIEIAIHNNQAWLFSESLQRIKYRPRTSKNPYKVWLFQSEPCTAEAPSITARLYNEGRGSTRLMNRSYSILHQLDAQSKRKEIAEGVQAIITILESLFILDPIPSHMRDFSAFTEFLEPDASNIAGTIAALESSAKKHTEEILTYYAKSLPEQDIQRVYVEAVGKFGRDAMLYCDESWGQGKTLSIHSIDARGLSDGSLRFLGILTALLTRPENSILIIEEIDNGLHPSRASCLLKMLKDIGQKRCIDIIISTHNPALLDALGPEMIPFIVIAHRDITNGQSQLSLLEDIAQLPKLLATGAVGKLSSQGKIEKALQQTVHAA